MPITRQESAGPYAHKNLTQKLNRKVENLGAPESKQKKNVNTFGDSGRCGGGGD